MIPSSTRSASTLRTREAIVLAVGDVLVKQGLAFSLREIAASAGITHPGLLRHFATKASLLEAYAADLTDSAQRAAKRLDAAERHWTAVVAVLSEVKGFDAACAALAGSSSSFGPAAQLLDESRQAVHALSPTTSDLGSDLALWSGLQVMAQYLPQEIHPADFVGARDPGLETPSWAVSVSGHASLSLLAVPHAGYRPGRERRERILADSTLQFARHGYHGVSVRDIALSVGVSASTLLHHFGTKEQLLTAVLQRRDELLARSGADQKYASATAELANIGAEARRDAAGEPGLIELYAAVSAEAASPAHPAHSYFEERYRRTLAYFTSRFAEARAVDGTQFDGSPWREAVRLVALWDGAQVEALRKHGWAEIPTMLDAHVGTTITSDHACSEA